MGILGYSTEKGDFLAEFPYDKAADIGILTSLEKDSYFLNNGMMLEYAFAAKNSVSTLADLPEISENGNIIGLTNYYDPSSSGNIVEMFSEGFGDLVIIDNEKFNVRVVQGDGIYEADVKQVSAAYLSENMTINAGNYFAAYAFSGDEITVNIDINSDIKSGYEIYSTKSAYSSEFSDGVLSVTVSEPQTLKVVFDGAEGKSIIVFIGKKGSDTADTASMAVIGDVTGNKTIGEAEFICPVKINVDSTVVYYPAIVMRSVAYITENAYVGDYNGTDAVVVDGDIYIPVSAFSGNGNIVSAAYDKNLGLIKLKTKSVDGSVDISGFKAVHEAVTSVTFTENAVSFKNTSPSVSINGIITEIDIEALMSADCLRLTSAITMAEKDSAAHLDLSIIGYNDLGETDIIAKASARAYRKTYDTTVYFDISGLDGVYENYYLVIVCDEVPGVVITLDGTQLSVFDVSADLGDNEFNPFA